MKKDSLIMLAMMGITTALTMNVQAGEEVGMATRDSKVDAACAKLSKNEQDFASKLSEKHRKVFCEKFSSSQRRSSMTHSCNGPANCGGNRNAGKKVMSPDDAVAKEMKDYRMSMSEKREEMAETATPEQAQ